MPSPNHPSTTNRQVFPFIRSQIAEGLSLKEVRERVESRFPNCRTISYGASRMAFHIDQCALEYFFNRSIDNEIILDFLKSPRGSERPNVWTIEKIRIRRDRWNAYRATHTRSHVIIDIPRVAINLCDTSVAIAPVRRGRGRPRINAVAPVTAVAPVVMPPVNVLASVPTAQEPDIRTRQTPFDNSRTYGVEIEFLYPSTTSISEIIRKIRNQGIECKHEDYNHDTRLWWKVVKDVSVKPERIPNYEGGFELVSPILAGEAGFAKITKVCNVLNEMKCKVNNTCGGHVHIGIKRSSDNEKIRVVRNAIKLYSNYQDFFNSILPVSRSHNDHCKVFDKYELDEYEFNNRRRSTPALERIHYLTKAKSDLFLQHFRSTASRYFVVNPCSVDLHGTCEFRQHSSTTDPVKLENWTRMMIRIVERAEDLLEKGKDPYSMNLKSDLFQEFKIHGDLKSYVMKRKEHFSTRANHPH